MTRKKFIDLMVQNFMMLVRLADKLKLKTNLFNAGYTRQQIESIMFLHLGGKARLKDIANRECVTTPNLCAIFRRLEKDGLIKRTVDEYDRRNTWYDLTQKGEKVAKQAMEKFRECIEILFHDITAEEELKLTEATKAVNEILTKLEDN